MSSNGLKRKFSEESIGIGYAHGFDLGIMGLSNPDIRETSIERIEGLDSLFKKSSEEGLRQIPFARSVSKAMTFLSCNSEASEISKALRRWFAESVRVSTKSELRHALPNFMQTKFFFADELALLAEQGVRPRVRDLFHCPLLRPEFIGIVSLDDMDFKDEEGNTIFHLERQYSTGWFPFAAWLISHGFDWSQRNKQGLRICDIHEDAVCLNGIFDRYLDSSESMVVEALGNWNLADIVIDYLFTDPIF